MLKIGVFGTGHLGKFHLNNWKEIDQVNLVGFYDPNDAIAAQIESEYQLKRFDNPSELMDACDAVDIVAPTSYHFELCQLALRKGKHVFVEKPLAQSLEEARALVKLAKESNRKCQVGHVERFNPAFLALKTLDVAPRFIEVHRLAEFNPRGTDVSVVLDLMIHDIDIILHLVKSNVSSVSANGVSVISDTPDIANVRLEFDNGCVANLTSSRISLKKMRKMRLFQKDAYIGIDFLERKTEIVRMDDDTASFDFHFELDTPNGKKTIGIQTPKIETSNAIRMELEAFRDSVLNNTEPPVSIIDGYRAMEVAHLILDKIHRQAQ
jgi:predicted dehydrogenase